MTSINSSALQNVLCERLCQDVRLLERPDGELMLHTHFEFPDGDNFPIYVAASGGGVRLSDRGHTLMHISYDHDIDAFLKGSRGQMLERVVNETGVVWDEGVFNLDTSIEEMPEAIFRFGQAITRVYDLTLLSRNRSQSTFYDDLADLLKGLVDEDKITVDYVVEDLPNLDAYPVDYRIEGSDLPLFMYGVPNRDKARLTTISLLNFHRHQVKFESLLIFEDQSDIPRLDLARLSDVGGDMISSLEAADDFKRKLLRRVA